MNEYKVNEIAAKLFKIDWNVTTTEQAAKQLGYTVEEIQHVQAVLDAQRG